MALFAFTLSPDVRAGMLVFVQSLFLCFVLVSFVCVAAYTARQVRAGHLFTLDHAPTPLMMRPPAAGWIYILTVLILIYLQSGYYAAVVLAGVASLMVESWAAGADMPFGLRRMNIAKAIVWGLLAFGAVTLVETPLMQLSIWLLDQLRMPHPEQQAVETFRQFKKGSTIAMFLIGAVIVFPVIEEFFFRGFLLTFLKNYTSTAGAIVLSAGVFAFAHLNLAAALPLWFLGIVLGIAYEHTGSLVVPMIIHSCFNLATGLSVLIEKGSSS
jgi:uncharacterized protein